MVAGIYSGKRKSTRINETARCCARALLRILSKRDKASAAITCCIIRSIWRDLMKRSKMLSLINTKNYYK